VPLTSGSRLGPYEIIAPLGAGGMGEVYKARDTCLECTVAGSIELLMTKHSKPAVKQHLASIRMLFNWLVTGQVIPLNPAHSVRGPKHSVKKGKTSVVSAEEMGILLKSISVQDEKTGAPVLIRKGLPQRLSLAAGNVSRALLRTGQTHQGDVSSRSRGHRAHGLHLRSRRRGGGHEG
jgi:serine/threonine protein kinase